MSSQIELFFEKSFSSGSLGSNQVDPVKSWIDNMVKRFILIDDTISSSQELEKKRKRNHIISVYVFIMSFRYLDNWFVDLDAPDNVKVRHGAFFHALGFGGKVILIVAACSVAQSGMFRLLFCARERKNQLQFLRDFSSFRSSSILTNDAKQSFSWKLKMFYRIATTFGNLSQYLAMAVTVMMCVYAAYHTPTLTNIILWSAWALHNFSVIYFIVPDVIILGWFWFVMRTHVKLVVKQVVSELDVIRTNAMYSRNRKLESDNHSLGIWYSHYNSMRDILLAFDNFSKHFMFVVSSTSSVSCSSFLFGILMIDDIVVSAMMIPVCFCITTNAVVLMSAATSINSLGKTMYKELNTVFVRLQHKLSIDHKVLLKQLIEDTGNERYPSVSLMTVNGTPFESMSFAAFIVSFITLFLMMFDFLHQVF